MDKKSIPRAFFRCLNRFIVVPAFNRGFGWLISNPVFGHIMVLKVVGRRTGKVYYTPVSYASIGKRVYCYQGSRLKGQWYLNIKENPQVEVILPDVRFAACAKDVTDPQERLNAIRQLLKDSGINRFIYGFNPFSAPDSVIQEKTRGIPVVRITPFCSQQ
jgi:deazaflavin-dependent oxidoreductase (nitroreductase family)